MTGANLHVTAYAIIGGNGILDPGEDIGGDCSPDYPDLAQYAIMEEDVNGNGVLDAGEDVDGDGVLDLSGSLRTVCTIMAESDSTAPDPDQEAARSLLKKRLDGSSPRSEYIAS